MYKVYVIITDGYGRYLYESKDDRNFIRWTEHTSFVKYVEIIVEGFPPYSELTRGDVNTIMYCHEEKSVNIVNK